MLIMFMATPRKTRSEDFEELNRINTLKKVVLLLRILLMSLFLCFLYFIDRIGLDEVRVFTIFSFIIIGLDILLNLIILFHRLKGLCRPGMKYPYARMNEDYVELQGGTRNLNNWLISGYDKPNNKDNENYLAKPRSNRPSYRSNVISEIPSIPPGTQYGGKSKKSQFTDPNSKKYSNWNEEEWEKHAERISPIKGDMIESKYIARESQGLDGN